MRLCKTAGYAVHSPKGWQACICHMQRCTRPLDRQRVVHHVSTDLTYGTQQQPVHADAPPCCVLWVSRPSPSILAFPVRAWTVARYHLYTSSNCINSLQVNERSSRQTRHMAVFCLFLSQRCFLDRKSSPSRSLVIAARVSSMQ